MYKIKSFTQFLNEFEIEGDNYSVNPKHLKTIEEYMTGLIEGYYSVEKNNINNVIEFVNDNKLTWYNDFMKYIKSNGIQLINFSSEFDKWVDNSNIDELIGGF